MTQLLETGSASEENAAARTRRGSAELGVAVGAAVLATATWVLWTQVGGVELRVDGGGPREVGVVSVILSTIVCVLAGAALLRWLGRRGSGTRTWTWLAAGVTAVSLLLGPVAATSLAAGLGLASLHVLVAAVAILGLRGVQRRARSGR